MHDITVSASQRLDGSLASEGPDQPMISTGFGELKPNIARYLAGLLILAADQADTWAGRPVAADVIAAADGEV